MLKGQTLQERGFHCSQPHTQSSPSPKLKPSLSFWPLNTCLTVLQIPFLGFLFWILHNFALYEAFSQQDSHLGVQEVPSVHSQGFHTSARGRRQNPSPALAVGFSSLWAIAMELPHTPLHLPKQPTYYIATAPFLSAPSGSAAGSAASGSCAYAPLAQPCKIRLQHTTDMPGAPQ